jgi:peptidoglycan hydrolase-like protein with peptidoglycan-binding domain
MKTIKLTEADLTEIVKKVLNEQATDNSRINKIKATQQALVNLGYNLGNTGPNKDGVDGKFGDLTTAAVIQFQKKNGIKQTGNVGEVTSKALGVEPITTSKTSSTTSSSEPKQTQTSTNTGGVNSPFKTKEEGNSFRKWVNDNYPQGARNLKLDKVGPHNNDTILKAWNFQLNDKYTLGSLYSEKNRRQLNINFLYCNSDGGILMSKNSKLNGKKWEYIASAFKITNNEIEAAKKTCPKENKKGYKLTPRIDKELEYIKSRNMERQPFFVYDPKDNLLYLFDKGGSLVDYTSVIDGADAQKNEEVMTMEKWCEISKKDYEPYLCTNKETGKREPPIYSVLKPIAAQFIPKGIYPIRNLRRNPDYAGSGLNVIHLEDQEGNPMAAAIHGTARKVASAELESYLKRDIQSGKVPSEYLDAVKVIANSNQSSGCINVPAKFIDNPRVIHLAQTARLFVMGEGRDYLVQNFEEYFDKLSGDGQRCVNPTSLASNMSNVA